mmetsp:Transcript_50061/g.157682  ORF Transcript_50061/g.157682 Transcript_50061/m.157682 type:complete len:291 (+) Transcript_50061:447-1319(+)
MMDLKRACEEGGSGGAAGGSSSQSVRAPPSSESPGSGAGCGSRRADASASGSVSSSTTAGPLDGPELAWATSGCDASVGCTAAGCVACCATFSLSRSRSRSNSCCCRSCSSCRSRSCSRSRSSCCCCCCSRRCRSSCCCSRRCCSSACCCCSFACCLSSSSCCLARCFCSFCSLTCSATFSDFGRSTSLRRPPAANRSKASFPNLPLLVAGTCREPPWLLAAPPPAGGFGNLPTEALGVRAPPRPESGAESAVSAPVLPALQDLALCVVPCGRCPPRISDCERGGSFAFC